MNLVLFLLASAFGLIVWWETGSVLFGLFAWVFVSVTIGVVTGAVAGDVSLDWDAGDSSDGGGCDGGGGD
jgi:hypothetical protein